MEQHSDMPIRTSRPDYFFPNRIGSLILLAMEEILGHAGLNDVLHRADLSEYVDAWHASDQDQNPPFTHISRLQVGLEYAYGSQAGRGLALRVGRACFRPWLHAFGTELGLARSDFRLLPLQARITASTEAFTTMFNTQTDQRVRLERNEKNIYWIMERCPLCWERHSDAPCCHLMVGFLQEALYWVSGGKFFTVEEKQCIACGDDACTIRIDQTPLA
jgi:predicted hydrocarbon binding protein